MKEGIACPECGSEKTTITGARNYADGIRRWRECKNCKCRFTTYEAAADMVNVIKERANEIGLREGKEDGEHDV